MNIDLVSGTVLGDLLNLDSRAIQRWCRAGAIVRAGKDSYKLRDSVRCYTKHLQEMAAGRVGTDPDAAPAPKPQSAPLIAAHVVPTPAAPAGVTAATPIAQPQPRRLLPAQSSICPDVGTNAYDLGAAAAAKLLGKAAPLPSGLGELALASREPEPDPRFDAAAMETGAAEAARLLGKTAA